MARVGFSIHGFSADHRDAFPFKIAAASVSEDTADATYRTLTLPFLKFFDLVHRVASLDVIFDITSPLDGHNTGTLTMSMFAIESRLTGPYTSNPVADELEICKKANQMTAIDGSPQLLFNLKCWDNSYDSLLDEFGIHCLIEGSGVSSSTDIVTWDQGSAVVSTFMGEPFDLREQSANPVTGTITIQPSSYWGYDGIFNTSTGARLIAHPVYGL